MNDTHPPRRPARALLLLALTLSVIACNKESAAPTPAPSPTAAVQAESPVPDASAAVSFEAELEFIDLVFKLKTHGDGARRLLIVSASRAGAKVGEPGSAVLEGGITTAFAADLNGDQQAELAVITKALDGTSGFTALAFNGSLYKEYRLPEPQAALMSDAAGADTVTFENGQIVRSFPIKAGGSRTLRYRFDLATGFVAEG